MELSVSLQNANLTKCSLVSVPVFFYIMAVMRSGFTNPCPIVEGYTGLLVQMVKISTAIVFYAVPYYLADLAKHQLYENAFANIGLGVILPALLKAFLFGFVYDATLTRFQR